MTRHELRANSVVSTTVTPVPPGLDAGLRRDIRALGTLLGETLVRQEGHELLELVEQVRSLMRSDRDAAAGVLALLDTVNATRLVPRVHDLLLPRQRRRAGPPRPRARRDAGSSTARGCSRRSTGSRPPAHTAGEVAADLRHVNLRPVFTAHPTEAARRSVLTKIRRIATLLDEWERAFGPDGLAIDPIAERRVRRRLEELVDLLWQTDELRVVRPEPIDEARNAVYYFDALPPRRGAAHARAARRRARAHRRRAADRRAPADVRHAGSAATATATRTSRPQSTLDVIALQHEHAIRDTLDVVDELRRELSSSVRITRCHDRARGLARGRPRAPARSSTRATGA